MTLEAGGGAAVVRGRKRRNGGGGSNPDGTYNARDLTKHVTRILAFCFIAYLSYAPFGTRWINNPVSATVDGWDENRTSSSWGTPGWSWDFIDCFYFAMVTMTTVGYGDMPTLRQEMRLFTILFGFIGVVVVAGSITVVADYYSQQSRKRGLMRQRKLLAEAHEVASIVRNMAADPVFIATASLPPADEGSAQAESQRLAKTKRWKLFKQVLKAMRLTGGFFLASILLGEIENSYVADCGFGSGWACGSPYSCEMWKLGAQEDDDGSVDRGYCWSWVDSLYFATITYVTIGRVQAEPETTALGSLAASAPSRHLLLMARISARLSRWQATAT